MGVRVSVESAEEATVWTELALGLTGLLLCEPSPAVRSSWITGPAVRLHQRMGCLLYTSDAADE